MLYDIHIAEQAKENISDIACYIAQKLRNPDAAVNLVQKIYGEIETLSFMPKRHRIWPHEPWKSREVRFLLVGNFHVLYHVDDGSLSVSIVNVVYGRQNI